MGSFSPNKPVNGNRFSKVKEINLFQMANGIKGKDINSLLLQFCYRIRQTEYCPLVHVRGNILTRANLLFDFAQSRGATHTHMLQRITQRFCLPFLTICIQVNLVYKRIFVFVIDCIFLYLKKYLHALNSYHLKMVN